MDDDGWYRRPRVRWRDVLWFALVLVVLLGAAYLVLALEAGRGISMD